MNENLNNEKQIAKTDDTKSDFKEKVSIENWRWREFILNIMDGDNNTVAYAKAYRLNYKNKGSRQTAATNASRLLRNANFKQFWREIIKEQGFNNEMADTELVKLIRSKKTPAAVRRAAIRDFNELTGRIVDKKQFVDDDGKSLFDKDTTSLKIEIVKDEQ